MLKIILFSLFLVVSTALYNAQGYATTLLYKNFNELVDETEGNVIGTVYDIESYYAQNKDIYTFVTFDQLEIIYGQYNQNTLTIRLFGGRIGNEELHVHGSPKFNLNDRVILFLRGNGYNLVPMVGWYQGVFRVKTDNTIGQEVIYDYQGNRILGIKDNNILKDRTSSTQKNIHGQGKQSEMHDESFVVSDDDITLKNNNTNKEKKQPEQQPMTVQEFVDIVKNRIKRQRKEAVSIKSINVSDCGVITEKKP